MVGALGIYQGLLGISVFWPGPQARPAARPWCFGSKRVRLLFRLPRTDLWKATRVLFGDLSSNTSPSDRKALSDLFLLFAPRFFEEWVIGSTVWAMQLVRALRAPRRLCPPGARRVVARSRSRCGARTASRTS